MSIKLDIQDEIALITFDDGGSNVIDHGVMAALESGFEQAEKTARVIVLQGRPGCFCAGYDIRVMTGGDPDAARALGRRGGRFAYLLFSSPRPLVTVTAGHAFTIGLLFMACADVRIGEFGEHRYGMTETRLNVPFSAWPLAVLGMRLNPAHQVPALLHSRTYDPAGALEAGFIDELVPTGAGLETALARARELAALPTEAYAESKLALRLDALRIMAADLELELE